MKWVFKLVKKQNMKIVENHGARNLARKLARAHRKISGTGVRDLVRKSPPINIQPFSHQTYRRKKKQKRKNRSKTKKKIRTKEKRRKKNKKCEKRRREEHTWLRRKSRPPKWNNLEKGRNCRISKPSKTPKTAQKTSQNIQPSRINHSSSLDMEKDSTLNRIWSFNNGCFSLAEREMEKRRKDGEERWKDFSEMLCLFRSFNDLHQARTPGALINPR